MNKKITIRDRRDSHPKKVETKSESQAQVKGKGCTEKMEEVEVENSGKFDKAQGTEENVEMRSSQKIEDAKETDRAEPVETPDDEADVDKLDIVELEADDESLDVESKVSALI